MLRRTGLAALGAASAFGTAAFADVRMPYEAQTALRYDLKRERRCVYISD